MNSTRNITTTTCLGSWVHPVPNDPGHLDIRDFITSVSDLEQQTGFSFGLSQAIADQTPDMSQWPTRIVTQELLGKLPDIDVQCPHAVLQ